MNIGPVRELLAAASNPSAPAKPSSKPHAVRIGGWGLSRLFIVFEDAGDPNPVADIYADNPDVPGGRDAVMALERVIKDASPHGSGGYTLSVPPHLLETLAYIALDEANGADDEVERHTGRGRYKDPETRRFAVRERDDLGRLHSRLNKLIRKTSAARVARHCRLD